MARVPSSSRLATLWRITTFRLTALLGMVFIVAVVGLLSLIYLLTERELEGRTDQVLAREARVLASAPAAELPGRVRAMLAASGSGLAYIALETGDGRLLAGNLPPLRPVRLGHPFEMPAAGRLPVPLRLLALRRDDGILIVGRDISQIVDLRARMATILLASGLVTALGVALAAVALSRPFLRRIQRLIVTAQRIAAGELSLRMPVAARGDELDVIAGTVNAMIAEIERLLAQVKGATDAIAHDLRAPLGRVRASLASLREQVPGAPLTIIEGAMDALDSVLQRFNALLRISELEASNRRSGFAPLDPMAVIAAVCELFEPLAETRRITLLLAGSYGRVIHGDRQLLLEAVGNLVDNAIKFTPEGGVVRLSVGPEDGCTVISVRDNGPGIPVGERGQVLHRFHRGSAATGAPGTGLGLHLTAAILHLHGFGLELMDAGPGLLVRILVPVDDSEILQA